MDVLHSITGFAVVAALLTVIPGLDTTLVLRTALARSAGSAAAAGAGVVCGALVWGAAAALGASALLRASETAYRILTLLGAAYVVGLGVLLLVHAFRRTPPSTPDAHVRGGSRGRSLATGFLTNLLNPKVGVFYLATIPLFVPAGWSPIAGGLLLASVHGLLTAVWFTAIIAGARSVARWLRSPLGLRLVDGVSGAALTGFGAKLALDARF